MGGEDELNAFLDRIAPARPMSKAELRRAKERLTGRTDEDVLEAAIARRAPRVDANGFLRDRHGNYI